MASMKVVAGAIVYEWTEHSMQRQKLEGEGDDKSSIQTCCNRCIASFIMSCSNSVPICLARRLEKLLGS